MKKKNKTKDRQTPRQSENKALDEKEKQNQGQTDTGMFLREMHN